jgi:hypothetical protein
MYPSLSKVEHLITDRNANSRRFRIIAVKHAEREVLDGKITVGVSRRFDPTSRTFIHDPESPS